eukprot:13743673-Alexandrium_andersonii.AAC.1
MYRFALVQCSRYLFQQEIADAIADLEHLDFSLKATEDFKEAMILAGGRLMRSGPGSYSKVSTKVSFMSQDVFVDMETANMEWDLRLMSRLKTIGVDVGKAPMLPWEKLIFGGEGIPNTP